MLRFCLEQGHSWRDLRSITESWLEMQFQGPHPAPTESGSLVAGGGGGGREAGCEQAPHVILPALTLENHWLRDQD